MAGAQGSQPIENPFVILQLDESAPPELVVDAYFMLVQREQASPSGFPAGRSRALHASYARAINSTRIQPVAVPDEERGHYAVLHLDPSADQAMIELAYAFLERAEGSLPQRSFRRYARTEAYRVLSNPQLRARYDDETQRPGTMKASANPRLSLVPEGAREPRKERSVTEKKKRGLFGLRRRRAVAVDAGDVRVRALRDLISVEPDAPGVAGEGEADAANVVAAPAMAELVFTAGSRAGSRIELNGNIVQLGEGKAAANVWRHGDRFLLKHTGRVVRIGGVVLMLGIVVLDDGDDIAAGADRARFIVTPPNG